jgi:dTDP-4-dehydrorhamnose reductase
MKVLITGAGGQLGWELKRSAPAGWLVHALAKDNLDVTNSAQVESCLLALRPQIVINAAAYTAVDLAERDSERAYAVNAAGAGNLAKMAEVVGARLVHISTDLVFSGFQSTPYLPTDTAGPLSIYGASKLEGERRVLSVADGLIVRTSWVYSSYGHNFVKTILGLLKERSKIDVITDQIGTPTWARGLAEALWEMAPRTCLRGVYHWTDAGIASWYDLAVAVLEYGSALGLVRHPASIGPVRTTEYPLVAKRPAMSVLDKTATWEALKRRPPHWRSALQGMLSELV